MEPWMVGLVALVVVVGGVIVYGALADRGRNRRRTAEMLAPPERAIPGHDPKAHDPTYVSELQARRRPAGVAAPAHAHVGASSLPTAADPTITVEVGVGYASKDFVTDTATRSAVLDDPAVLVCADPVETIRELLPVLEQVIRSARALVLVAPRVEPDVLGTLEVNVIQGKLRVLVVTGGDADRAQIAELTGATPVDRSDRRSGWVTPDRLGNVARWVSTRSTSTLTGASA